MKNGASYQTAILNAYVLPSFRMNRYFSEHLTLSGRKTAQTYSLTQYYAAILKNLEITASRGGKGGEKFILWNEKVDVHQESYKKSNLIENLKILWYIQFLPVFCLRF